MLLARGPGRAVSQTLPTTHVPAVAAASIAGLSGIFNPASFLTTFSKSPSLQALAVLRSFRSLALQSCCLNTVRRFTRVAPRTYYMQHGLC